jgi:hypothetical protein
MGGVSVFHIQPFKINLSQLEIIFSESFKNGKSLITRNIYINLTPITSSLLYLLYNDDL